MAEMDKIQELLRTGLGTEGQLLLPRRIHDVIIEEVDKNLIPRSEAAIYVGPAEIPGSSYDFNLVTPDTMDVRLVAEGAEIPIDQVTYTSTNVLPSKYGVAIRITRELLEDAKWNLLQHNVQYAGKRIAENENSITITALDGAANTVSGGASITIANITRAMQYLEDSDFTGTSFFVGMEVLNDLRNIDTFVEYNKIGNTEMLTRGFLGNIYGLNVVKVSTNAGMTSTSSYVIDRTQAYAIVEKRPVTVENFELPTFDMSAAAITQRIAVSLLRSSAVAKITTT
mgnify:CR=1 FL=1